MPSKKISRGHAAGDRNFCGTDLRGQSFKGQNLLGVDFSQSDIRGTDFSYANLQTANFSHCRAGLAPRQTSLLTLLSWLVTAIAGIILGITIYIALTIFIPVSLVRQLPDYEPGGEWIGWLTLILFGFFEFVSLRLGPTPYGLLGVVTVLVGVAAFFLEAVGFTSAKIVTFAILLAFLGQISLETIGAIAIATLKTMGQKRTVIIGIAINAIATISSIHFMEAQRQYLQHNQGALRVTTDIASILIPVLAAAFTAVIGHGIFQNTDNRPWLRKMVVYGLARRGTSFKHANLIDADFTAALLPNTNIQSATITRTNWWQALKLQVANVEKTYLEDPKVQQLVASGQGQDFDYKDLRGVNLQNADLTEASFVGANLSEANLAGANLARAKLVRAQLYRANLSHAELTGAYIQDWGISTETRFDGVNCDYIYMRSPTPTDPDPCRKPDNRNETFAAGDFENFIAPIIKTLNLYSQQNVDPRTVAETYKTIDLFHHDGIDPGAAAIALQQLADQHPEAGIEVVALEGRGQDQIRLQAVVSSQANRSELSAQYSENYRQLRSLPYSDLQTLLSSVADKDQHIQRLETMLEQAIQQPRFYVETYRHQGEFVMSQSKGNINIDGVQGNVSGVAAAGEQLEMTGTFLGNISGSVSNTINQLPNSAEPAEPGLKELLIQLQAAIEAEAELNDEDKAEALEQVKVLAEAGQYPEEGPLKKTAKTAVKILKGTVASLPKAAELVKESNKLLLAISALLAIA